jgi:hypothetical protein
MSRTELEANYSAEIKSLKSNIKTLKREATLAQKASSADKVKILSLKAKVVELEGKLLDLELERDSHIVGGLLEELAQINSSAIESLRLELEQANEDLNSKKHEIECMEKGKESSDSIYKRALDSLYSVRSNLMEENSRLREMISKKEPRDASHNEVDTPLPPMNNPSQPSALNFPTFQTISVGGAEAVSLLATALIIASSLMSPMLIYIILTLLILAIIWFMIRRRIWNSWKKVIPTILLTGTIFYHLRTFLRSGPPSHKFEARNKISYLFFFRAM